MRLIDLRCAWMLQYATESTQYDPAEYSEPVARRSRLDGYLMGTALAFLDLRRTPADWERQADRWTALGEMIGRAEAEFSGRLLARPDDAARWREERAGSLCWGLLTVADLDPLVRQADDLDRLAPLFQRGVRVFGAVDGDLTTPMLAKLLELAPDGEGPRPAVLLSPEPARVTPVLDWFETDASRSRRLPILCDGVPSPEAVGRLRALGAMIGVRPTSTAEGFLAEITALAASPFQGREGFEGIGIASDYLGVEEVAPELDEAAKLLDWIAAKLPAEATSRVVAVNARRFALHLAGVEIVESPNLPK